MLPPIDFKLEFFFLRAFGEPSSWIYDIIINWGGDILAIIGSLLVGYKLINREIKKQLSEKAKEQYESDLLAAKYFIRLSTEALKVVTSQFDAYQDFIKEQKSDYGNLAQLAIVSNFSLDYFVNRLDFKFYFEVFSRIYNKDEDKLKAFFELQKDLGFCSSLFKIIINQWQTIVDIEKGFKSEYINQIRKFIKEFNNIIINERDADVKEIVYRNHIELIDTIQANRISVHQITKMQNDMFEPELLKVVHANYPFNVNLTLQHPLGRMRSLYGDILGENENIVINFSNYDSVLQSTIYKIQSAIQELKTSIDVDDLFRFYEFPIAGIRYTWN